MNYIELFKLITGNEWRNTSTNEICSFSWIEADKSINISFKSGERSGKSDAHKFVQLYLTKEQQENCDALIFQSNLFTSEFSIQSEDSHLFVSSKVFGDMELERLS